MHFSFKVTRLLGCALIVFLLMAQAAFAMRPCVDPHMTAAGATAMSGSVGDGECCQTSIQQLNLCVDQCTGSDRLSAHTPVALPVVSSEPVAIVDFPPTAIRAPLLRLTAIADPPKTVRFCSFLI